MSVDDNPFDGVPANDPGIARFNRDVPRFINTLWAWLFWPSPVALIWAGWQRVFIDPIYHALVVIWFTGFFAFKRAQIRVVVKWMLDRVRPPSWLQEMAKPKLAAMRFAMPTPGHAHPAYTTAQPMFEKPTMLSRFVGAIWRERSAILLAAAILTVMFVAGNIRSCLPTWAGGGTTREIIAENNAQAHQWENEIATDVAIPGMQRTLETERRNERIVAQAHEEITHAVSQEDFDAVHRAYVAAYERVWDDAGESVQPADAPGLRGLHTTSASAG